MGHQPARIHCARVANFLARVFACFLCFVAAVGAPASAQVGAGFPVLDTVRFVTTLTDAYPRWSPDGRLIAFQSDRTGSHDIWLMDADGGRLLQLTDHPALDETPVWSPDGRWIYFASERDGELDIFRMARDGSGLTNLTRNPGADDDHPKVSWNGELIVFNSKRHDGETYQIWIMRADGSDPRQLTSHYDWDTYPSLSPDGRKILFRRILLEGPSRDRRNSEVFVMDADGTNLVNLTRHRSFDGYPDWSPDGGRITFASDRDRAGIHRVYVMNADGSDARAVSPSEPGVTYARPHWGPDGRSIIANRELGSVTSIVILDLTYSNHPVLAFEKVVDDPSVLGGALSRGVAWGDVDGDSYPDLVVANANGAHQFVYRNEHGRRFRSLVEDPTTMSGGSSEGVSLADYDGDGDLDLLVTNQFDEPIQLFQNTGGAEESLFIRVSAGELGDDTPHTANSACWADYDLDGHLDVFVVNRDGVDDLLFHNEGDGTFRRIHGDQVVSSGGDGRTCAWSDVDGDGDPDLYVGNFLEEERGEFRNARNFFFVNDRGSFRAVREGAPVTNRGRTYGATFADVDGDGDPDLFLSNIGSTDHNALYLNDGAGHFTALLDGPIPNGASRPSKGHTWGDFDLDGDLDLYVVNGTEADVELGNFLFVNDGSGRFTSMEYGAVVEDANISGGVAWADYDRDGDLDLYAANWGNNDENNVLYRNDVTGRHWIAFSLEGTRSNRMGVGTRVRVQARIEGELRWQVRWLWPATGYASQNEPIVHFGLAGAILADSVEVLWPSGLVDRYENVEADRFIKLVEGETSR